MAKDENTASQPTTAEEEAPAEYSEDDQPQQSNLSAIDKQYAAQTGIPRRIHILGTGSIGKLVAHSLRGIAKPPPITLIFHRYKLLQAWEKSKKEITIHDDGHDVGRGGFEVELKPERNVEHGVDVKKGEGVYDVVDERGGEPHEAAEEMRRQREEPAEEEEAGQQASSSAQPESTNQRPHDGEYAISDEPIHNLIITTKAAVTLSALTSISHRLSPTSTICFLQNGMGIIDEINTHLFPDEKDRPNYIQGIITHGANVPAQKAEEDPFYAVHAGHGTIALGLLPRTGIAKSKLDDVQGSDPEGKDMQSEKWAPSARYLLRTLTRCPVLCAVGFTPMELFQLQLEKLVMNSIINPLTSLLDARNGSLLYNFALTRTMRLLLAEISTVIQRLPELQNVPNVATRFSTERLETVVVAMCNRTKDNVSSMLADVRAGRRTEIEYINGYVVIRGEEVGVKCVVNYAIMQTVIGKVQMVGRERREEVPEEKGKLNNG